MDKSFNIYINGTGVSNGSQGRVSLANVLHATTEQNEHQESICLEGCAINNTDIRDLGGIFTFHLEAQIDDVVQKIRNKLSSDPEKIILNLYGFSRGGAAVFWMSQKLKDVSSEKLEINICSFEPVPGNFIRGSYIDNIIGFKSSLSGIIADLSDCHNIKKMLVLFTNAPLPDIACHGPILPVKPPQAEMKVDVIPGCHANCDCFTIWEDNHISANNKNSAITFHYVTRFLKKCGTKFNNNLIDLQLNEDDITLNSLLESKKSSIKKSTRSMHFYNEIVSNSGQKYLNLLHKELITQEKTNDSSECALSIKDPNPQPSYWNGQKSNAYLPKFAAGAGIAATLYYAPAMGTLAASATAGYYLKNHLSK